MTQSTNSKSVAEVTRAFEAITIFQVTALPILKWY